MGRIVCDPALCSGCLACVTACMDQHYEETQGDAVSPRLYEKRVPSRTGMTCYVTRSCHHCKDAPCVRACPAEALYTDERGFVIPRREACVGCRACAGACPYDVPRFDGMGKLVKCDGCATRVARGLEPACVRICALGALRMED